MQAMKKKVAQKGKERGKEYIMYKFRMNTFMHVLEKELFKNGPRRFRDGSQENRVPGDRYKNTVS